MYPRQYSVRLPKVFTSKSLRAVSAAVKDAGPAGLPAILSYTMFASRTNPELREAPCIERPELCDDRRGPRAR